MKLEKKAGGYITVEASFVFPIVIFIIMGLLKFSFEIYNNSVDKSLKIYLEVRADNVEKNYYNAMTGNIDIKRIVNEGFINTGDAKREVDKLYVEKMVSEYRNNIVICTEKTSFNVDGSRRLKNSTVVRCIHIVRANVGRITEDD